MDTIKFSQPEQYMIEKGMFHCLSCIPKVDVRTDGCEQKVSGHAHFDIIVVRVVDPSSVEFTY